MIAGAEVDGFARESVHEPAVELEVLRRNVDLPRCLGCRLAGLEALERHELGALLPNLTGDFRENAPALDRPAVPPGWKCRASGGHGGVDVRGVAAGDLRDRFPRKRAVVVQIASRAGKGDLPVDEVIPAPLHPSRPESLARSSTPSKILAAAASTSTPPAPAAPAPACSAARYASYIRRAVSISRGVGAKTSLAISI